MAFILDPQGNTQEVTPDVTWYKAAADAGQTFEQYVNSNFKTDTAKFGPAYRQLLASEGIVLKPNHSFGLRSPQLKHILEGRPEALAGGIVRTAEASSAALRALFPTAILTAVEDRLIADLDMNANAFDGMVAITDVIAGDKFERPLLNYTNTNVRARAIAQNAEPKAMLSITTSGNARAIPALSLGVTISDQAKQATTLDLVGLGLARQVAYERNERANEYVLAMLQGDLDNNMASLSSLGYSVNASALDSASTGGTLTHKAWMKFLYRNSKKRVIDWVVTDINGALAIETRTGKPTNSNDNPNSPRIDSVLSVANPTWRDSVNVFITDDPNWPAGTIMGLDSRFAIHRVQSSTIAYQAVEQFVLRRAESMRIDFGEIAYRFYDDAFDTLVLA